MNNSNSFHIIFYGTSKYAVMVLQALHDADMKPMLVVTTPDKPAGKHLTVTPSPVKIWAQQHQYPLAQPERLRDPEFIETLKNLDPDLGIVVAYGKIIPQEIIDLPHHKTLNVHASLLPKLRGASPIETAILQDEKNTGVTIMALDAEMDHGPVIVQEEVIVEPWPPSSEQLGEKIVAAGADLLIKIIPQWMAGTIASREQNHSQATYTSKIKKEDAFIDFTKDTYENFRKIQAYGNNPKPYFFHKKADKEIRVIIKKAAYDAQEKTLTLVSVVPEGKKEMSYEQFKKLYF